jgi:hypothetical protein
MEKTIGATLLARAEKLFKDGQIVEVARGTKPFARFHTLSHSIRFMVPYDLRYARCDCATPSPCIHVPLAVMAFRLLSSDQVAGTVVTAPNPMPINNALIAEIEKALNQLAAFGIAQINPVLMGELKRASETCANEELVWPAEILQEVVLEIERYQGHDARYSAEHIVCLIAELLIRFDTIKAATGAIPVEFVKGLKSDKPTDVASTRLVGLGCGGSVSRFGSSLVAYMQDVNSGNLVTLKKDFVEKSDDEWRSLYSLSEKPALKALGLGALGKGQILTKGGKMTPTRVYMPGRCQFTFNHQSYQWELLRPPLAVDSFAELRAIINANFPSYVAPRYSGRDFYVCAVNGVEHPRFNEMDQTIEALLIDRHDEHAQLIFPYYSVSAHGCRTLLYHLKRAPQSVKFVAGHVQAGRHGLVITPVAVIFEEGDKRTMIQPWVDRWVATDASGESLDFPFAHSQPRTVDPLHEYLARLLEELGSLMTAGFERVDTKKIAQWKQFAEESDSLGFSAITAAVFELSEALAEKPSKIDWDPHYAASTAIDLAVIVLVAQNESIEGAERFF